MKYKVGDCCLIPYYQWKHPFNNGLTFKRGVIKKVYDQGSIRTKNGLVERPREYMVQFGNENKHTIISEKNIKDLSCDVWHETKLHVFGNELK